MEKINKMFKGMYIAMGIAGIVLAALSLANGFAADIFSDNIYGTILIVLASLAVVTMLSAVFNNTLFENTDKLKLTVVRGHISAFFGFSSYLMILANETGREMTFTLLMIGILAVYFAVMVLAFFWFINRIEKRIEESEKDKIDG